MSFTKNSFAMVHIKLRFSDMCDHPEKSISVLGSMTIDFPQHMLSNWAHDRLPKNDRANCIIHCFQCFLVHTCLFDHMCIENYTETAKRYYTCLSFIKGISIAVWPIIVTQPCMDKCHVRYDGNTEHGKHPETLWNVYTNKYHSHAHHMTH